MKKKLFGTFVVAACTALCASALAACGGDETKPAASPTPDYNKVEISGLDDVFIDRETESFGLMDGVTATYKYDDGKVEEMSDEVKVVLPAHASVDNGKVTFDKCGDYEISYYINDSDGNCTVAKRDVKVRNIYNCYWMSTTLPVLYCALDIVSNNYKSMLTFTRTDTLNIDELDDDRFLLKVNGAKMVDLYEGWRLTARIADEDEYSYFRVFVNDAFSHSEILSMMRYKIPSYRYETKLVSDGTMTYGTAFAPYRGEDTYDNWLQNKKIYDAVLNKALQNNFVLDTKDPEVGRVYIEYKGQKYGTDVTDDSLQHMGFIAAQRDNVELWCNYPETLVSKDPKVQAEINKAHMPKKSPKDMYNALSEEQKQKFLAICGLDKEEFDKTYFAKQGKYLIITGTNPFTGSLTDEEFATVLSKIATKYGDYNLLFKPHPRALEPTAAMPKTSAVLKANDIQILPGRLPMEVISWVYSDVALGGFDSSLYMAVPQGNIKFFISNGADALTEISKQLYNDGAFGNPEFYWKDKA